MSNTFSFSRLGRLIQKQFFENLKFYSFSLLALAGLLAIVLTFWVFAAGPNYHEEQTWIIFLLGLFISGCVFASMSFNMLGNKDKGVYWLGIPATHFEKLVCTIFFSVIVFTAAYCLCFFTIRSLFIMYITNRVGPDTGISYRPMGGFDKGFGEVIPYFIYGFFGVQSLYLLGSVYFPKYSFVVTTVIGAILFFSIGFYMSSLEKGMFGNEINWNITSAQAPNEDIKDGYMLYSLSPFIKDLFKYSAQFIWAPLFWFVAWFRLKEKEI